MMELNTLNGKIYMYYINDQYILKNLTEIYKSTGT